MKKRLNYVSPVTTVIPDAKSKTLEKEKEHDLKSVSPSRKEDSSKSVPPSSVDIIHNSDGTITLAEDVEIIFADGADGIVINILEDAIVENGVTIRTGPHGGEMIYANGHSSILPAGFIVAPSVKTIMRQI